MDGSGRCKDYWTGFGIKRKWVVDWLDYNLGLVDWVEFYWVRIWQILFLLITRTKFVISESIRANSAFTEKYFQGLLLVFSDSSRANFDILSIIMIKA